MAHCLDNTVGQSLRAPALARVQADLHPLELGEDVIWKVEGAVREDVALAPAEDPERRERRVGGRDLLALPADVIGVEARDDTDVARVVANRQVLVAERLRSSAHLLDRRLAVGGRRVHMEVAADVRELEQVGRRIVCVDLAELRWPKRTADACVHMHLRGRIGQVAERGDVLRRAGRAHELGSEPIRLRRDHLDRVALGGDADDAPLVLFQHGHDLRQRLDVK